MHRQYRTGKTLGSGTYAIVKEAVHIKTGKYYACKVINKKLMEGREYMVSLLPLSCVPAPIFPYSLLRCDAGRSQMLRVVGSLEIVFRPECALRRRRHCGVCLAHSGARRALDRRHLPCLNATLRSPRTVGAASTIAHPAATATAL